MSDPDGTARVPVYPVKPSARHYANSSELVSPAVVPHPDADPRPGVQISYPDGSWAWVTDARAARDNAAAWTEAATRLDEMNAARAAAGKAAA